ncbi:MAG: hypothetical protein ACPGII_10975, partial [Opitutales bacterium]
NPAVNVRSHAAYLLSKKGKDAFEHVQTFLEEVSGEPVLEARALWILAQIGDSQVVEKFLENEENEKLQVVAYRALRHADPKGTLARAKKYADSGNLHLRREIAVSLRDVPFDDCRSILENLMDGYDGRNRYYLEALGVACHGKEKQVYDHLVSVRFPNPAKWGWKAKNLAWRLHTPKAVEALDECIRAQEPPVDEFRFLAMAFASFRNDQERTNRIKKLRSLASLPAFEADYYQITVDEIIEKDLNNLEGEMMEDSYLVPQQLGQITKVSEPVEIAKLKGDPVLGKTAAAKCYICHKIEGVGVGFGPDLTHWGKERTAEEIIRAIVYPDEKLAHGYDKPVRLTSKRNQTTAEGLLSNYSWHA